MFTVLKPDQKWLLVLLVFVPGALLLQLLHASGLLIFIASAIAIIPLAGIMGQATDRLAQRLGEGIGGLLTATFGNAAELIIAVFALRAGLYSLVKASITGSIIGNILLVFGASAFYGGLRYRKQSFNPVAASQGTTMLLLSTIGLVVPAIFHVIARGEPGTPESTLSTEIAIVLLLTYIASLVFTLKTHRYLYRGHEISPEQRPSLQTAWRAGLVLAVATIAVAFMSELLVETVRDAAGSFHMNEIFVGVILVAIIGNAAEHFTALIMAGRNRMDIAINIAVGSSIQIALFVAPLLVLLSYFIAPQPMDLIFSTFEVLSVAIAVGIMAFTVQDGESHWMEGVQLLAVYLILGLAFFFLPV